MNLEFAQGRRAWKGWITLKRAFLTVLMLVLCTGLTGKLLARGRDNVRNEVLSLQDYQVIQRTREFSADFVLKGTIKYDGIVSLTIQDSKGNTVAGYDEKKLGKVSTGVWQFDVIGIPVGGPYAICVTFTCDNEEDYAVILDVCVGDLWIAAGQSHLTFGVHGPMTSSDIPCSIGTIRPAGAPDIKEKLEQDRGWHPDIAWRGDTSGYTLAREFRNLLSSELEVPIGVFVYASGASFIKEWEPSSGHLYRFMADHMNRTGVDRFKGVLWFQGENEAVHECMDPEEYIKRMEDLVAGFRELADDRTLPVLMVQIGIESRTPPGWLLDIDPVLERRMISWRSIQKAQEDFANSDEYVFITTGVTETHHQGDIHMDDKGLCRVAKDLYDAALYFAYGRDINYETPRFSEARLAADSNTIEVFFRHASGVRLDSWEGQFNVRQNGRDIPIVDVLVPEEKDRLLIRLGKKISGDATISYLWRACARGGLYDLRGKPVLVFFDKPILR